MEKMSEDDINYAIMGKELRLEMNMNRTEFCEYFGIPYRTVQDWEAGKRKLPDYVLRLMRYKYETEKLKEQK